MKTLQQEYQLIKEGKGNKDHFLKIARHMFPEYITIGNDFNSAIHILKGKSLLSEAVGGIVTMSSAKQNWFKIFNDNIQEAIGVKNTKEYGDQNEFEKIDKDVAKDLANQFDNNDPKNIDNLYGQSFLLGYLTEMSDPTNAQKTVDELKAIVAKNMAKDINYYHINASFGIKGIGYTKDSIGMGEPEAPKGKYKSSGYGDISKSVKEGLNEAKKGGIDNHIKSIDKAVSELALEAKIDAIDEAIKKRKQKLSMVETMDELKELVDPIAIKKIQKEIQELEKHKSKQEKMYEKMMGKGKQQVIDEDEIEEGPLEDKAAAESKKAEAAGVAYATAKAAAATAEEAAKKAEAAA